MEGFFYVFNFIYFKQIDSVIELFTINWLKLRTTISKGTLQKHAFSLDILPSFLTFMMRIHI